MEEKIVIEKELLEKIIKSSPIQWFDNKEKTDKLVLFGKEYKTEKYPTNWEELKELCKGMYADITEHSITLFGCLEFWDDGKLSFFHYSDIAYNLTPAQMWNIIKNLVEER